MINEGFRNINLAGFFQKMIEYAALLSDRLDSRVYQIYTKKLVCTYQRIYMLFALWVYMLLESERGRAVIYVDCRVTPGRFGYAIATLIDSTSSCFSVYRKSSITSRPLIQVYSIRGQVIKTCNPPWFHIFKTFFMFLES